MSHDINLGNLIIYFSHFDLQQRYCVKVFNLKEVIGKIIKKLDQLWSLFYNGLKIPFSIPINNEVNYKKIMYFEQRITNNSIQIQKHACTIYYVH